MLPGAQSRLTVLIVLNCGAGNKRGVQRFPALVRFQTKLGFRKIKQKLSNKRNIFASRKETR
jgi:hypothetical protein